MMQLNKSVNTDINIGPILPLQRSIWGYYMLSESVLFAKAIYLRIIDKI